MHEFKVGDKVRAVRGSFLHDYKNRAGVLKKIDNDNIPYLVDFSGVSLWCTKIEPYEDTEPKVGQTVRCLGRGYVGELVKQDQSNIPYCIELFDDKEWCDQIEPFNTHGLDIVHADDKTVTLRLTHEELVNWACVDLRNTQAMQWSDTAHELSLNKLDRTDTDNLRDFVRNSPLLDHLRPKPEPKKWVPKPSDPVRFIGKEDTGGYTKGKVYITKEATGFWLYTTLDNKGSTTNAHNVDNFEPATDFRVGDVVEVINDDIFSGVDVGDVVELVKTNYKAEFKNKHGNKQIIDGESLSDYLRHTDKPLTQPFKPGWYVQVESEYHYGVVYKEVPRGEYKTRIDSELKPIKFNVRYSLSGEVNIDERYFTESKLRQYALDIARDGSKTIGCTTITSDELPELIKFFEEFIPMARKAVKDEKARLGE